MEVGFIFVRNPVYEMPKPMHGHRLVSQCCRPASANTPDYHSITLIYSTSSSAETRGEKTGWPRFL